MYDLKRYELPKDGKETYRSYIKKIYVNAKTKAELEEAKDKIFRLTYPWALNQLKKYSNLGTPDEFLGDMSVAFMKTFNSYDPDKEGSSFIQYYGLAIRCEVINAYYGRYRGNDRDKTLLHTAMNLTTYLDEPVFNKDTKETGTKADLLVDNDIDFDKDMIEEDYRKEIFDLAWEALNSKKHKKVSEDVYLRYIELILDDDFKSYAEIARELGKSLCNVRKIILEYNGVLAGLIKERGGLGVR